MIGKSFFLLLTVSLVLCAPLFADTIPGGYVSGIWYADSTPHYITGDITIPQGDTLIIEPGVLVNFLGQYSLTAKGFLEAVGTAADSIQFFPNDSMDGWFGILLNDTSMGYTYPLSYCKFRRMMVGIWQNAGIGNAIISNCNFYKCLRGIEWLSVEHVDLQVTDCVFQNNFIYAIRASSGDGLLEINGCLFENHMGQPVSYPVIWATGRTGTLSILDCIFRNNEAQNGGGAAIHCDSSDSVIIEDCLFAGNINSGTDPFEGGGAIFLSNTDASISRCLFHDNDLPNGPLGDAIMIRRPGSWIIDHCTFWGCFHSGNEVNIYVEGDYDTLSSLTFSNSIFTEAHFNLEIQNPLTLSVEYCDFFGNGSNIGGTIPAGFGVLDTTNYNGDSCDVYGNIFMDPLFADTANRDFHLTWANFPAVDSTKSPCIDAGDPLFAYDPDGTITDMGMYYYHQVRPEIQIPLSLLDFDSVTVADSSSLSFNIYNIGDANLLLIDVTNNLSVYTHDWNASDSIVLPGDSLEITVTFTPDDSVAFTDTLLIDNNDTLAYVELMGVGKPVSGISEDALDSPLLEISGTNPFYSRSVIRFGMPRGSKINLSVYDITGRCVKTLVDGEYEAGIHEITFDGTALSQGIYFCVMKASGSLLRQKLILLE